MTFELNGPAKDFEKIKKVDSEGVEYWEARELMPLLGYVEWRKFEGVIGKAMDSCKTSQQKVSNHFGGAARPIISGKGGTQIVNDFKLSRYACYLIAQNGDSRKQEIALAQTYFAIQTRKQELSESLTYDEKRLQVRSEVSNRNKKLFSTAKQHGVKNFGHFNNAGYLGLYGLSTEKIKKKKNIENDDILDRAGAVELAANLFRITQTDALLADDLEKGKKLGEEKSNTTHFVVGTKVRKAIKDIGGTMPEELAPEEHIKSVKKKIGTKKVKELRSSQATSL